jgi:transposase
MKKQRRKFSSEFKENAAKLVLEQGMTRTKVAQDLGVNINQISKWVQEYQAKGEDAFPGNGNLSPQDRRIKELEAENRQLRMERDILKKATAFFANHGR